MIFINNFVLTCFIVVEDTDSMHLSDKDSDWELETKYEMSVNDSSNSKCLLDEDSSKCRIQHLSNNKIVLNTDKVILHLHHPGSFLPGQ